MNRVHMFDKTDARNVSVNRSFSNSAQRWLSACSGCPVYNCPAKELTGDATTCPRTVTRDFSFPYEQSKRKAPQKYTDSKWLQIASSLSFHLKGFEQLCSHTGSMQQLKVNISQGKTVYFWCLLLSRDIQVIPNLPHSLLHTRLSHRKVHWQFWWCRHWVSCTKIYVSFGSRSGLIHKICKMI